MTPRLSGDAPAGANRSNDALDPLTRAHDARSRRAWAEAFEAFTLADVEAVLVVEDLEDFAWSAALLGRDEDFLQLLERQYHAQLAANRPCQAARAAFWICMRASAIGQRARATGWLGRAKDLIEVFGEACAEYGYLRIPCAYEHLVKGDLAAAEAAAAEAVTIGRRFEDPDLLAIAQTVHGRTLISQGRLQEGLGLLDQAMLAATSENLVPPAIGVVYCSTIASCNRVFALDRAREWTAALAEWCNAQPQLVGFAGICMVHRAEVLQLGGAWDAALAEARRASERFTLEFDPDNVGGNAYYQQAEIHRLRGEFEAAEAAYRVAAERGREPQPGLALLRLAQGQGSVGQAALRRVLATATAPLQRAQFLPAWVEVCLAVRDVEAAELAAKELSAIARQYQTDVLSAMADHARGAIELERGNVVQAVEALERSLRVWTSLGAPYIAARLRVQLANGYEQLGDGDAARRELATARELFQSVGAAQDLALLTPCVEVTQQAVHALSARELQVLRLVTSGMTNKAIAAELGLSEKTVDRHVSNIFAKLDVPTRAAATAYAYSHKLV